MMRIVLTFAVAVALLAGCGGADSNGDGESNGDGDSQGEGYSVELPDGWEDRTEDLNNQEDVPIRFDRALAKDSEDGFATNVNAIREGAQDVELEEAVDQFEMQIRGFGATDLSDPSETDIDGEEAFARDYRLSQAEQELRGRQVVVKRDDRLYTVTFTAREDAYEEDLPEFEEILDSWQWD